MSNYMTANPLDLSRSFPIGSDVANLLQTCYRHGKLSCHVKLSLQVRNKYTTSWQLVCYVVVMEFDTTHQTQVTFGHANLIQICYWKLWGKRCNRFWESITGKPLTC